ncbi:MAG: GntR family transcriptional regulator [Chthoniobacterales bacterium]|nr:GntR family transcriptional regulator [Chthoniobacterales bacterium]
MPLQGTTLPPAPLLASKRGLKKRLQDDFLNNIRQGTWRPNARIPTESDLAVQYQTSRTTIRQAIQHLEEMGLLKAVQGSGRFVSSSAVPNDRIIGVVSTGPDLTSSNGLRVAREISRHLHAHGDSLMSIAFHNSNIRWTNDSILSQFSGLAGLILHGPAFPTDMIPLLSRRVPVVAIGRNETAQLTPSFLIDYGSHAALAASTLLRQGHRRILLTHGRNPTDALGINIERGLRLAYLLEGEDAEQAGFFRMLTAEDTGRKLFHQLQEQDASTRPTALISYGILTAAGYLKEAKKSRATDCMEIIILNELESDEWRGRISAFQCPIEEMTRDTLNCLYGLIQNAPMEKLLHEYTGKFLPRE